MNKKRVVGLSTLPSKKRESEQTLAISRPIHQAATKQLIGAMVPGEVLCVAVTPEKFKDLGIKFNGFVATLHEGNDKKICFIMKEVMQDLVPILRRYYAQNPCAISVIEVEDSWDFNDLSEKTGIGAGTKKYDYENRATCIGTYQDFYNYVNNTPNWKILNTKIKSASEEIPPQEEDWSCCINSAARALVLVGHSPSNYYYFLDNCPKGNEIVRERADTVAGVGVGSFFGSILLSLIPPLAPVAVPLAVTSWVTTAGSAVVAGVSSAHTMGCSPRHLSAYINQHLPPSLYSRVCIYDTFSKCATDIIKDIKLGDPVIAFLLYAPTAWHYANVVAVQGNCENFMMLDTNQYFKWLSYHDMEDLMRNDYNFLTYFACKGPIGKYNIIRFYKR